MVSLLKLFCQNRIPPEKKIIKESLKLNLVLPEAMDVAVA